MIQSSLPVQVDSFCFFLNCFLLTGGGNCQALISRHFSYFLNPSLGYGNKLGLTCAKLRLVKALAVNWQCYLVKSGKIIFSKIISEVPNNES